MELNREQIVKALEKAIRIGKFYSYMTPKISYEELRDALVLIRELTESLDRVQKQCGEIIVECDERDAKRLKQVAELTEENERLKAEVSVKKKLLARCSELVEHIQADTVRNMQIKFQMYFGTYTADATIKVSDVFRLLDKFTEEMLEEEGNGDRD